eukprot:scaffold22753_cov160-Cylindrotheca_fusiformis.AAC.5
MYYPNDDDSNSMENNSNNNNNNSLFTPANSLIRRSSILLAPHPETMENVLDIHSPAMRQVARELLLDGASLRSRRSIVDVSHANNMVAEHYSLLANALNQEQEDEEEDEDDESNGDDDDSLLPLLDSSNNVDDDANDGTSLALSSHYGAIAKESLDNDDDVDDDDTLKSPQRRSRRSRSRRQPISTGARLLHQITAVAVICLLNIMVSIPFGSSYFPVGWRASTENGDDTKAGDEEDDVHGMFPLQNKQALGIRMFLFATLMGQLAFTFASKFTNPVGLQMVENVPFLHALCHTVIQQQGYGKEALSTVFFLFGLSSIVVGLTFYVLGKWQLGRIVYFFPNHVLVGCIGGIGVFLIITSIEVTSDVTFTFDMDGLESLVENFRLLAVVLAFEGTLRVLMYWTQDERGHAKYPYLSPVYYCMITPLFYLGLRLFGVNMEQATEMGYFFPVTAGESGANSGVWHDDSLWDIFRVIDLSTVSWRAVFDSTGTMIALAAFSLIHVPINIPAFAISTDVEVDMNAELMAHGYSNLLSGIFGGLQNYVTYSNSVLYAKSGGNGRISSLCIVALTMLLFVIGPEIASYLPRCMAGTLLLHIGIDLFLEGVYDSFGNYDQIEYAGIWVIALVMTIWGMTAALIAGVIAALSTYAVQIFFGNIAQLTDTIKDILKDKGSSSDLPIIVIVDFTLVVGMDSSAAHAVAKLQKIIHRLFGVELSIFVTGSDRDGFPCEFDLSTALTPVVAERSVEAAGTDWNDKSEGETDKKQPSENKRARGGSISVAPGTASVAASKLLARRNGGQVYESLDEALRFAEDVLIARQDASLVNTNAPPVVNVSDLDMIDMTMDEEKYHARRYLLELFSSSDVTDEGLLYKNTDILLPLMKRREYKENQTIWEHGDESDSAQLLVFGQLVSIIEDTGASEQVQWGNFVGELGLVHGMKRLTTLVCSTEKAVTYSLEKEAWQIIKDEHPQLARMIDAIVIRYLAHRVQHVSNRYFHTTLPV